jgi:hypothetical protein
MVLPVSAGPAVRIIGNGGAPGGGWLLSITHELDSASALLRVEAQDWSRGARGGDQAQHARESAEAADVIGARLYLDDLEDTRIAEGDPTIGVIDRVVAMVACRRVGRVYCFQSPSATVDYRPVRQAPGLRHRHRRSLPRPARRSSRPTR